MTPALEDAARVADVSRSTVSRLINDHPNASQETRERVWETIRTSGYQPHQLARSLVTRPTQIIGMIIPEAVTELFSDPFFSLLLCGAAEACNAHHYQMILFLFSDPQKRDEMYQRVLCNGYLDGVIIASVAVDDPMIPRLLRDGIPFVSLGRHPDERVHYVDIDNLAGAQVAVEHLIRLGHRRIATITGRLDMTAGQDCLQGYRQALAAHRIPVEEERIAERDFAEGSGVTTTQRLLGAALDATFVASDHMAVGALKVPRRANLRVPEDIALVGFDDTPLCSLVEPALTTVRQPIERLGSMAVELLLGLQAVSVKRPTHKIIAPAELVVRASCGALLHAQYAARMMGMRPSGPMEVWTGDQVSVQDLDKGPGICYCTFSRNSPQTFSRLQEQIVPPRNRVTMAEIAEQSGVSISTVSLVLRDKPGISPDTRERVLGVARERGYIPRDSATQHQPVLTTIAVILKAEPDIVPQANLFYSHVLAGIELACRKRRVNLLYATMTVNQDSYPLELPRILVEDDTADGLLLVGAFLNEALAQIVERRSTPVVLVDAYAISGTYDAVVSANFEGAYEAVNYLIRCGHRHIGLVGGHPNAYPSIQQRRAGYVQALADSGIAPPYFAECHIICHKEVVSVTSDLLRENPAITAIFVVNDEAAIAAMEVAQELGRRVPDDLSVVGFDDIDLAECVTPSLTTMHVDKVSMGRVAVQLLANRLEYPESSPVTAVISPHLIERDSVRTI